jgi:hypothetical protein
LTRISAPRNSTGKADAEGREEDVIAAAEANSALEISMINLCEFL